ncbi:MAG TPA: ATP-dependent RecD-like DNA helicase [Clostridiales bacterium]|jgi:exodeoxyribonuclease V alpha subunit|nr:ATP-dependent RecD-like DNA helicase [Clostridiales bacterium]
MEKISGTVEEIIYNNENNGYTVGIIETSDDVVTFTGLFSSITLGEHVKVEGDWMDHPRYGKQFQVKSYEIIMPDSIEGIKKYLASGLIKGVGDATASKIVEEFGEDTFNILQYHPEEIMKVEGIGEKKAEKIVDSFREQLEIKEIMLYLQKYNISPSYGIKIYKEYGNETIEKVKENPYRLTSDIYGIGFKLADKIAESMGIDRKSEYRISAGVRYSLMESASDGHTYLPKDVVIKRAGKALNIDKKYIEAVISNMALRGEIHMETIDEEECVYYIPYYYAEAGTANKLVTLITEEKNPEDDVKDIIKGIEERSKKTLTKKQKLAIEKSFKENVMVITGGPGTGKTTIIKGIIEGFELMGKKTALCAPTGRAAKRITETTGREAKTIHRMLEFTYSEDSKNLYFNKNEESPLEYDVIIVDEMSMVDIILMNSLLKAVEPKTHLIMVGDVDQLPSVGPGSVLRDIINSNIIPTIKLDKIFRQSNDSMITINAHRINDGEMPEFNKKDGDFFFIDCSSNEEINDTIVGLVEKRLPEHYNLKPLEDIQVLTPMKKSLNGTYELNKILQNKLNPMGRGKEEIKNNKIVYRTGDKIMQIKNNYQMAWKRTDKDGYVESGEGVFNGDIGYIRYVNKIDQELVVEFDDNKEVTYTYNQLDELIHAYAVTIHKSQGSEFPAIIIPVTWAPPMLLTRNLIYTAVTRAQDLVVLVGYKKYVKEMIDNNRIDRRYSNLKGRLDKVKEFLI